MSEYIKLYDEINKIICERYILLQEKCVDWNSIADKYKRELKCIHNDAEFVKLINNMLLALEDGHVNFRDIIQTPSYFLPFTLNFIQSDLVVTSDSVIPKGAIILKVNDEEINNLISSYPSFFPLTAIKMRILENIQRTLKKETKFEYLVNNRIFKQVVEGNKITQDIFNTAKLLVKDNQFCGIQTKKIDDVHYLKILMFDKNVYQSVSEWLIGMPSNHSIVIDLRGCSGGDVLETMKVTSLFLENNVALGKKVSIVEGRHVEQPLILEATTINKNFKQIIILVDNFTASSSEFIFIRALSNNKNVILIGEETAGIIHGTNKFIINKKYLLTLTTHKYYDENGCLLSSKGIVPSIFIPTNINDDVCLKTAIVKAKT